MIDAKCPGRYSEIWTTPHLAGALGAGFLRIVLKRKWVVQDLDSRILSITDHGRRELLNRFAIQL